VTKSNVDDWKKLGRCIKYLQGSKHLVLMLDAEQGFTIKYYVDASFAVHPDMQSHSGATSHDSWERSCLLNFNQTDDKHQKLNRS
jgi:hypothetical protein